MRYKKIRIIIIFVILGLCITTLAIWGIINNVKNEIKFNLLSETRSIARSINTERLQSLSGNLTDLDSPNYSRLKSQLYNIRSSNKSCRFLYIMGQNKNGDVFFFVDSQLPDSKDYASPGLIYEEVPDEYLFSFTSGLEQVVGPVKDRWDTLLTALIPIYDFETNELIAVLGMDIEAENWYETIFFQSILLIGFVILTLVLIILSINLIMKTKELKILAGTDSLTKIHNRRKIFELVEMELNRYERNGGFLSVIAIDLDRFKPINDKFGHFVGDIILRKVSSTIKGMIRKTDHIGRVGGDEFVILLPDASEENAVIIAEKIRAMVALLKFEEKKYPELSISVSLGISAVKEKQIGVDKLLDQADMALYTSKQKGRNQISVY